MSCDPVGYENRCKLGFIWKWGGKDKDFHFLLGIFS